MDLCPVVYGINGRCRRTPMHVIANQTVQALGNAYFPKSFILNGTLTPRNLPTVIRHVKNSDVSQLTNEVKDIK